MRYNGKGHISISTHIYFIITFLEIVLKGNSLKSLGEDSLPKPKHYAFLGISFVDPEASISFFSNREKL